MSVDSPFEITFWEDQVSFKLAPNHRLEPDDTTLAFAYTVLWGDDEEEHVPVFVGVFATTNPRLSKFDLVVTPRAKSGEREALYSTKNYVLLPSESFSATAAAHAHAAPPSSPCFLEEPEPWHELAVQPNLLGKLVGGSEPQLPRFASDVDGVGLERLSRSSEAEKAVDAPRVGVLVEAIPHKNKTPSAHV